MKYTASRYHDFSYGHRVVGQGGKCEHLHGHNGRVTFNCTADAVDGIGMVVDFSVIKSKLCQWVEDNWDHRFLVWEEDEWGPQLKALDEKVVLVPFNPTAENMAAYLADKIAPKLLPEGIAVESVVFRETEKCSATANRTFLDIISDARKVGHDEFTGI